MGVKFDLSSKDTRFTVTIQNDTSFFNGHGQGDLIHTWLVVTDNEGGPHGKPANYAIS